jgi:hypothetical protein
LNLKTGQTALVRLLAATVLLAWVVLPAADALARAGGGSSGGSHSSSSSSYSRSSSSSSSKSYRKGRTYEPDFSSGTPGRLPWEILYFFGGFASLIGLSALADKYQRAQRLKASQELLSTIAKTDKGWRISAMKARVEQVYFKVQEAWTEGDQEICKDMVSPRLYAKHKADTDAMTARGIRNVLTDIQFIGCEIVYIADRKGVKDDEFWAQVFGSMMDGNVIEDPVRYEAFLQQFAMAPYTTGGGPGMSPKPFTQSDFCEIWKFTRSEDGAWVLDSIEQSADVNLSSHTSFSDGVNLRAGRQQVGA